MSLHRCHTTLIVLCMLLILPAILQCEGANEVDPEKALEELRELSWNAERSGGVLSLDANTFQRLVLISPKNYTTLVLFTAEHPRYHVLDEDYSNATLFFVKLDVDQNNAELFREAAIATVPHLVYFGPRRGESTGASKASKISLKWKPRDIFNLSSIAMDQLIFALHNWTRERTGVEIPLIKSEPPVYQYYAAYAFATVAVIYILRMLILNWRHPMTWFFLSLVVYGIVLAGTVFNAIREPEWYGIHPWTLQTQLFHPNMRHQYVWEGIIMAVLRAYNCAHFSDALLTVILPNSVITDGLLLVGFTQWVPATENPRKQRTMFVALMLALLGTLNLTFKFYSMKFPGYPYRLHL